MVLWEYIEKTNLVKKCFPEEIWTYLRSEGIGVN